MPDRGARLMKLGVLLYPTGYHIAAWRHPDTPADSGVNFARQCELARLAEEAKLDFIFLADSLATQRGDIEALKRTAIRYVCQFEPITLLSALAAVTGRIGLVGTASTTYHHPFHVARMFLSLDHISGGRAGWNVVTGSNPEEAASFGADPHPPAEERYRRAREFTGIVYRLWESWDEGAFVRDKASGLFFDPSKRHPLRHRGSHFAVAGPLPIARSPQGRPVVFQAGASDSGIALAAETAEVVFTAQANLDGALLFAERIRERARAARGAPDEPPLILPGVMPFIGRSRAEAQAKLDRLQELIDPVVGLSLLEGLMPGIDLSRLPLDGPLPEPAAGGWSRQGLLAKTARDENLTIRQLVYRVAAGRGHRLAIGTAASVADELEHWFRIGAADGFNLIPHSLPGALRDMAFELVPELRRRGLFRTDYEAATLRGHLGLPLAAPSSVSAAAAEDESSPG